MSDLTANESKNGLDFDLRCNCVYPKRTPQAMSDTLLHPDSCRATRSQPQRYSHMPKETPQMTDSLRSRIAAAIYNAFDDYSRKLLVRPDCPGASELEGDGKPVCYVLADAVIRDVLTPEFLADLVIAAVQKAANDGR